MKKPNYSGLCCSALLAWGGLFPLVAQAGETVRISVTSSGEEANAQSAGIALSDDGRYAAFVSNATNLVPGVTNGYQYLYVRDNQTGTLEVVVSPTGTPFAGPSGFSISADGRYVAFRRGQIYVYDRQTKTTELVSKNINGDPGNVGAVNAMISANGRYVTYNSAASNLVEGDTNFQGDVFLYDRETGVTERVSVSTKGDQANNSSDYGKVSADGRYVAFSSHASNLVAGDTGETDVFVRDRVLGTTELVSKNSDGTKGNAHSFAAHISNDGRYVVFDSEATNLGGPVDSVSDVFVHDRFSDTTQQVSLGLGGVSANGYSLGKRITEDGRYVLFISTATNLVQDSIFGQTNVYLFDRKKGTTSIMNVNSAGTVSYASTASTTITPDGRYVGFSTASNNLVENDTNGVSDVFIHERLPAFCL